MYTTAITVHDLFSSQTIFLTFTYCKKAKVTVHFSIGNLRMRNDLYDIFAQYILKRVLSSKRSSNYCTKRC